MYDLFTYSSFGRLSAKKVEGVDPALKEMVKAIRDALLDITHHKPVETPFVLTGYTF